MFYILYFYFQAGVLKPVVNNNINKMADYVTQEQVRNVNKRINEMQLKRNEDSKIVKTLSQQILKQNNKITNLENTVESLNKTVTGLLSKLAGGNVDVQKVNNMVLEQEQRQNSLEFRLQNIESNMLKQEQETVSISDSLLLYQNDLKTECTISNVRRRRGRQGRRKRTKKKQSKCNSIKSGKENSENLIDLEASVSSYSIYESERSFSFPSSEEILLPAKLNERVLGNSTVKWTLRKNDGKKTEEIQYCGAFYTEKPGYRVQLRATLDRMHGDVYFSVRILSGVFDDQLVWPFAKSFNLQISKKMVFSAPCWTIPSNSFRIWDKPLFRTANKKDLVASEWQGPFDISHCLEMKQIVIEVTLGE